MGIFGKGSVIGGLVGGPMGFMAGSAFDEPTSGPGRTYNYRSVKDVDLSKENPELYKRIKAQDQIIAESRRMYEERRKGMNDFEQQQLEDSKSEVRSQLGSTGLAGSSIGLAAEQNAASRLRNQIMERIYNEQNALYGQYAGQSQMGFNMTNMGQQGVLGQLNKQIDMNVARDQAEAERQSGILKGVFGMGGMMAGMATGGPQGAQMGSQMGSGFAPNAPSYNMPQNYSSGGLQYQNGSALGNNYSFGSGLQSSGGSNPYLGDRSGYR